jgi:DinB superfamily
VPEERIVEPDPVKEPEAYQQALLDLLGGRDVLEVLAETPTRVTHLTAALDEEALAMPPEPGEWSAEGVVAHLFNAEMVYAFRWRLTLAQEGTSYPGYDQDAWVPLPRPPFGEMLEAYTALRRANIALVAATPKTDWEKVAHHEERGPESFGLSVQLIAGHDIAHLLQLEQTVAAVQAR